MDHTVVLHKLKYSGIDIDILDNAVRVFAKSDWKIAMDNHEIGRLYKKIVEGRWARFVYYPSLKDDGIPISELIGEPGEYVALADEKEKESP